MSSFPIRRMRRLRRTAALRRLVQETHLVPSQLVWPLFVCHGSDVRREVALLPGVYQTSVDELVKDAERAHRLGLGGIMLFGLPAAKDATGSEAYDEQGVVQQGVRAVKRAPAILPSCSPSCSFSCNSQAISSPCTTAGCGKSPFTCPASTPRR